MPRDYDDKRSDAARRSKEQSAEGRDIAPLPVVVDPARRALGERDLEFFLRTYLPASFKLAWSVDHREVIAALQSAILEGGQFAYAMPRGSGKTTLAIAAALWALIYGHRDFVPIIASDAGAAASLLDSIRSELECNELLAADFPEVCYPIKRLEGIAHRCAGQLLDGERTHISWTQNELVLPTVKGSKASAGVVRVTGITGAIRGMQFTRPDGRKVRPSLAIVDDPQTNESARSPSQVAARLKTIEGSILGLAGPGVPMACVITCTVIEAGDVADQLLDQQKRPDWQGKRAKLMYAMPTNDRLWEDYARVRADGLRAKDGGRAAKEFYVANREAMDEGAHVAWPDRKNPDEVSAVQHAMNLRIKMGVEAFETEYQNDPPKRDLNAGELTAEEIVERVNNQPRGIVPVEAQHVVAHIDIQGTLLYYTVAGVAAGFGTAVIDYGSWPDQQRSYFTLADAKKTFKTALPKQADDAAIYSALEILVEKLAGHEWKRADGSVARIGRILIDANWGKSTDVVYKFCRQSKYAAILMPAHGKFIGASGKPYSAFKKKAGEIIGDEWMIPNVRGSRAIRHVLIDVNHWKTFAHARLAVPVGDRSAMTFFGKRPDDHRMLADQYVSEYRTRVSGRGRELDEWKLRPHKPDNHLLDNIVGCLVAASMLGIRLIVTESELRPAAKKKPARKRVFYME